jgi:DNA-binding transcriptional ArsR family regulator
MDPLPLTEARALRAYSHPTRIALVGLLRRYGPLTATRAAELTGQSVPSCSYHLRVLAKYGLVEEAEGGQGREKPWRVKVRGITWPGYSEDPAVAAAATALSMTFVRRYFAEVTEWLSRQGSEPPEWQDAAPFGDMTLYLTAGELDELRKQVWSLLERYAERTDDPALRPGDARRVSYVQFAYPAAELPPTRGEPVL